MKQLSELSTLGIGGGVKDFFEAHSIEEMRKAILTCRKKRLHYLILGKGSNVLFDDRGFNGAVIVNKIDFMREARPGVFHIGAGNSFSLLGVRTARQGWSGLEFASGIPGSVGGAIFMNAGANGTETCESLDSIDYLTDEGKYQQIKKDDVRFSYRYSSFHSMDGSILGGTFILKKCDQARKKQLEILNYRKKTQPYDQKSAGCMFRNPPNHHAGALIEQCGLKGFTVGGAKVSEVHANFIINTGKGKSGDILTLGKLIEQVVKEKTGVELQLELRYIPYRTNRGQHDP
ncbi:MAG: UDP-N-acetylmuramate dehydrogenase [Waddliaceae bacterium]